MGCCGGDAPAQPDYAAAAVEAQIADVETLPLRKAIESAARAGGKITVNGKEYDFSGLGDAAYNAAYEDAMAQAALQVQKEMGPDYIAQRRLELQTSDPAGWAMRQQMFRDLQGDLSAPDASRPTASALQQQILADLERGGELTPEEMRAVSQSARGQAVARGNARGNAAASAEAGAVGAVSEQRNQERQQRALAFLVSGTTPEDVDYRRNQQNLSNLGSFIGGVTPTAQFKQLSGAGNGAVPFATPKPGLTLDPNAGATGANYASTLYGIQSNAAASQINPWMAGLGLGAQGVGVYSAWGGFQKSPTAGLTTAQANYMNGLTMTDQ